jgi:hypothetical protein
MGRELVTTMADVATNSMLLQRIREHTADSAASGCRAICIKEALATRKRGRRWGTRSIISLIWGLTQKNQLQVSREKTTLIFEKVSGKHDAACIGSIKNIALRRQLNSIVGSIRR